MAEEDDTGLEADVCSFRPNRLKPLVDEWVQEPTTMPWGNRSALFRDPDGNLVNLFAPVTEEAITRFSGRT